MITLYYSFDLNTNLNEEFLNSSRHSNSQSQYSQHQYKAMADADVPDRSEWTISKSISLGMIAGIAIKGYDEFNDIMECYHSCDSWILIAEKFLTYVAYMMGAAKSGQVVYRGIRYILNYASVTFLQITIDEHEYIEGLIEGTLAYLGQRQLADLWDYVREASLCIKMNNCEEEFLEHLNKLKLSFCDVELEEDDWYSGRKVSTCEKLFDDSPLILLAIFVLILLGMIMWQGISNDYPKPPHSSNQLRPVGTNKSGSDTSDESVPTTPQIRTVSSTSNDPETGTPTQPADASNNAGNGSEPQQPGKSPDDAENSTQKQPADNTSNNSKPAISPPTQPMNTTCPTCNIQHQVRVPRPMSLYCSKRCTPKLKKLTGKELDDAINAEVTKQVDEFMSDVQKILCSKCKKVTKPNVCLTCGEEHI